MSAFKQKLARLGATAGVLAASTAAIMAAGGVTAGSASAACSATIMKGQGSSLQKIAQESIWSNSYISGGCGTGTNLKPEYTSTSSGKGLGQWGFTAPGGSIAHEWKFIGTDDGPSEAQINNGIEAAGGASATRHVIVMPATQTAIAIVYNPPEGCSMPGSPAHITNENLEKAFDGEATAWSTIGAVETGTTNPCPGTKNLTRVVREEGSGTTYQFKNYLAEVNKLVHGSESAPCGTEPKWSELEEIGTGEEPNKKWPSCGTIAVERQAGGGKVAEWVAKHPGRIGYAALPDAKNNSASVLAVQNNGINASPTYQSPVKGTTEEAACANAEYNVPLNANKTKEPSATGLDVVWAKVFGGNPKITGTTYSICTLTYDIGWQHYEAAGFAAGVGTSVQSYYKFILSHGLGTTPHYYAPLPSKTGEEEIHNVKKAAEFESGLIGN